MSSVFAGIKTRRLKVLEVGPVSAHTIEFLGQVRSRIHVYDLFSEPLVRSMQNELDEAELKAEFQKILQFKVGTLIDVCLFWDFLNYLTPAALRAFSTVLRPYIHSGTRGHGFSVLNVETPLKNQNYGIVDTESIAVRPGQNEQLDYFPHPHQELSQSLNGFKVGRGWLLPDGRLEILLDADLKEHA